MGDYKITDVFKVKDNPENFMKVAFGEPNMKISKEELKRCEHCGQELEYYEDKQKYCVACFDLWNNGKQQILKDELEFIEDICSYMEKFSRDLESGTNEREAIIIFQDAMDLLIGNKIKQLKEQVSVSKGSKNNGI